MRILVSWLRDFVDVPDGADELGALLSMRGFALEGVEAAPPGSPDGDVVLDVEVTANRPDCLSVTGIAREVATAYDRPLRLPGPGIAAPLQVRPLAPGTDPDLSVEIDDPELCPRYAAAVVDVTVAPSPEWLTARLMATGVRPINNVVDVTNYVLIELGHPMHAFDMDRLADRSIRVRRAREGETIRTLDDELRRPSTDMLVIADAARAQAVGGVMGGADSEVSDTTRVIALESAYFKPTSVRSTSKRLALKTEASARFERGADIAAPVAALERACALLEQIGAGHARGTVVDRYPAPRSSIQLTLRRDRITRVVGQTIDDDVIVRILTGLGFAILPTDSPGTWRVDVPTRRVDVSREVDLIEEVARHHGFDHVPATFPVLADVPAVSDPRIARDRGLRELLRAAGFSEAMTFTFIERLAAEAVKPDEVPVPVANPLSETFAVLRPSLWPGLLDSIARNRRRTRRDVCLFEIGSRFSSRSGESRAVAFAGTGASTLEHWSGGARPMDFFDAKGLAERLCAALGVSVTFVPVERPELVAGRAARIRTEAGDDDVLDVGLVGQLSPAVAGARDLPADDDVYVGELDLDALARSACPTLDRPVRPLPRFPSIVRDLSMLVDDTLPAASLRDTIHATAPATLVSVQEFDRYQGQGIPEHSVSLSFRLTFRSPERTLTDDEVQQAMTAIVDAVQRLHGATLR